MPELNRRALAPSPPGSPLADLAQPPSGHGGLDAGPHPEGGAGRPAMQHWTSSYAGRRIHLIGVGGSGMRGLAGVLLRSGARVGGSDRLDSPALRELAAFGATLHVGHDAAHLPADCDLVVCSAAIAADHPELAEARRRGLIIRKYAEMLGEVMRLRTGVAVAGTHGKSTTTAMVAWVLRRARLDPTFVIGAEVEQLGGSCGVGDGPYFVVEACEYDRSFLNYAPHIAAILNIEEDHLDCYPDLPAIIAAFGHFAAQVSADGLLLVQDGDRAVAAAARSACARVESFGFDPEAVWAAADLSAQDGCYRFTLLHRGRPVTELELSSLPGRHQVCNALVAAAVAHHAGVSTADLAAALATFRGALRRLTYRGGGRGIDVYDDYAHHPTEIQVTLRALREHQPGRRLWVIFQPHQHSRTRFLLKDFAGSFGAADHLIVPDIYFVRDSAAERAAVCAADLVEHVRARGGDALYLPDFGAIIVHVLEKARPGDLVITMGAGDIGKVADELVQRLA